MKRAIRGDTGTIVLPAGADPIPAESGLLTMPLTSSRGTGLRVPERRVRPIDR